MIAGLVWTNLLQQIRHKDVVNPLSNGGESTSLFVVGKTKGPHGTTDTTDSKSLWL